MIKIRYLTSSKLLWPFRELTKKEIEINKFYGERIPSPIGNMCNVLIFCKSVNLYYVYF